MAEDHIDEDGQYGAEGQGDYDEAATPRTRLDGLHALQDQFQLDAYVKAAAKVGKGLGSLLKRSMSRTPTKANASGTPGGPGNNFGLEDLLIFSNEPIPTSLLKMSGEHMSRAVKMFSGILKYMGETGERLDDAGRIEIAQKLLHQGLKRPELKDELFMQLLKQTRGNPNVNSRAKAWEVFHLVAATMPPSKDFVGLVSEYIHGVAHDDQEAQPVRALASKTWNCLKRSAKAGPRRTLPSTEEIEALLADRRLNTIVFFLDETFEELAYDVATTVLEAVEQLAAIIKLQNYSTFTLFECRRMLAKPGSSHLGSAGGAAEPSADEHLLLDDNKYIADVLCEFRNSKQAKEGFQSRLLFKKRMFRETDETVTEPQFINLSYVQAQHDYLLGNYPVVREDAAQMCALQIQAEHASTLTDDEEGLMGCIEKYITKQVLMTRPREEWFADVLSRYRALGQFSKEDARLQFLRILRSLPYGNSIFFQVKRIEDPIGLLPAKLILGINKRGVHFFRPVPKEYLHSAELRDIMQFGSSSTAVFFKMRVAGVLHIFQFETRQGEDICMALQTHINDIMMKRYSKAKAMATADGKPAPNSSGGAAGQPNALGLAGGNFGPRYEAHVAALQKALEETQKKLEDMTREVDELKYQKEQLAAELSDVVEAMTKEEDAKSMLQDQLAAMSREVEAARSELTLARSATATVAASSAAAVSVADGARLGELTAALDAKSRELAEATDRSAQLDKRVAQLTKEKELIEKKMQRIEKAKETETGELRSKLEAAQGDVRSQLKSKDDKIGEILEELAGVNALYAEAKEQVEQAKHDERELEELRELKSDIERKEKQQAAIIEHQAKRLEELEKLYRDEQVARKRAFNAMEDMKGKIRVYCRVRPILPFETDKGQAFGLNLPDELTVTHAWKDEKKPREYNFDQVFNPAVSQEAVFEDTRHLIQSAVDGYNVCIFAYGQTGSGKTFTIYGSGAEPGLTPRGVAELFKVINRDSGKYTFSVTCYMLELYQDSLMDLLLPPVPRGTKPGQAPEPPKLEIKKDPKGLVTVAGATVVEVTSAKELMATIENGQQRRHVASTQMNRESSRSHLIISIIIESTNLQTQTQTRGKLSFVDLAGSERVKKSGSTGENLKEAQAINKSLSALGDVISALATEQQHIPYRNHKLTMLMSDSLGGNAKTLMFVNVSPTDGNLDETQNSLQYATRVRTIKNEARKDESNKDMLKLKKQIDYWKDQAGVPADKRSWVDLMAVKDERQTGNEDM
uniref:Kinesin motor domain-containing protein n=1 Tax=Chlamydomonas leiostraca TaxID=1034604 RepID=A0A7S0WQ45_9CHLO|mmetsp:Transcript_22812/g.58055  ORF Transcript_22812/g.58055 Transcript_22812/m.58055 type:complete len:1260 (+) Transcript_22812:150-3929(+)|eukprot:CAMPEP_0202868530 /NCGR_PEP_ID=MMETSP1391-20130828/10928_1 /ASSEMBLY_ACC=CAM_ASM_000867 /TAXON_ID=1034604 /ORGANISM="Chlamydomonas leiostraca, Strain SAG 11-49" /LENGTH=1259 /DNA_ID=CAMNT_0049548713 /DNA_START=150 /DNA_END=3929 /DNA_ORIENTATION=+